MSPKINGALTILRKRAGLALFAAMSAIALSTLAGLIFLDLDQRRAAQDFTRAREAANLAMLADERMSMSVRMAAATGDVRWAGRYTDNAAALSDAVAQTISLAPSREAARFSQDAADAQGRAAEVEVRALALAGEGNLRGAQALLDQSDYLRDKRTLSADILSFSQGVASEHRLHLTNVRGVAGLLVPALVLLCIGFAGLIWRAMSQKLRVSERAVHAAESAILDMSLHDGLTGVPNRRALREQMPAIIARAERGRTKVAAMVINLDGFKQINSDHGHMVGDLVLKEITRRVARLLRHGEVLARIGADEYVVVVEHAAEDAVKRLAHGVLEEICLPMRLDGHDVQVAASIGLAMFPTVAANGDELAIKAEVALQRAKSEGKGAIRIFDLSMDVEIIERLALERDLVYAVHQGGLTPHFQPIVELATGKVTGFEILARWRHPVRGYISPAEFLPMVEAGGLMNEMTIAVLEAACEAARALPSDTILSLNVTPHQIQDDSLVARVLKALSKTGFSPRRLEIEVSENALMNDLAAAKRVVIALKAQGVRVALDDFGSGYSSLRYVAELPFDAVKIDALFVRSMHERTECARMVAAIVSLAKSMGIATVAENVESASQADMLRGMGCDAAQGFYFSKPLPAAQAALLLALKPEQNEGRAIA
jgi:diguanylate cyclase (GGDEF)-like protein